MGKMAPIVLGGASMKKNQKHVLDEILIVQNGATATVKLMASDQMTQAQGLLAMER